VKNILFISLIFYSMTLSASESNPQYNYDSAPSSVASSVAPSATLDSSSTSASQSATTSRGCGEIEAMFTYSQDQIGKLKKAGIAPGDDEAIEGYYLRVRQKQDEKAQKKAKSNSK
jgi:hypothetical protein